MTDVVTIALIAAVGSTLAAIGTAVAAAFGMKNSSKLTEVHGLVDGRLTQVTTDLAQTTEALRALTEKASIALGVKEEKERGAVGDAKFAAGVKAEKDRGNNGDTE
jgi:hypothetical protein